MSIKIPESRTPSSETCEGALIIESDRPNESPVIFRGKLRGWMPSVQSLAGGLEGSLTRGYGEAVFNTSLTGYQEILTDPSYFKQIICMTAPHIGNTGLNSQDNESSKIWCAGLVIHDESTLVSNWRAESSLLSRLALERVPFLVEADTRAITRYLRTRGVARALLLPASEAHKASALFRELPAFEGVDFISQVSTRAPYRFDSNSNSPRAFKVSVLDFGVKTNLLRMLSNAGCECEVFPSTTGVQELLKSNPDGVFLSNGPGDPSAAVVAIQTVKNLIAKKIPVFGVCMGHQVLALASGAKTYKLKFGHRGGNHPVKDFEADQVQVSSHNHGYAVDEASLPREVEVTHKSLNDQTIEGIRLKHSPAFSVQYHPEACPGPHDSYILFERFIDLMRRHPNVSSIS